MMLFLDRVYLSLLMLDIKKLLCPDENYVNVMTAYT